MVVCNRIYILLCIDSGTRVYAYKIDIRTFEWLVWTLFSVMGKGNTDTLCGVIYLSQEFQERGWKMKIKVKRIDTTVKKIVKSTTKLLVPSLFFLFFFFLMFYTNKVAFFPSRAYLG